MLGLLSQLGEGTCSGQTRTRAQPMQMGCYIAPPDPACMNASVKEDGAHLAIERGLIHFHEPVYPVLALVSYFVDSIYVDLQQKEALGE